MREARFGVPGSALRASNTDSGRLFASWADAIQRPNRQFVVRELAEPRQRMTPLEDPAMGQQVPHAEEDLFDGLEPSEMSIWVRNVLEDVAVVRSTRGDVSQSHADDMEMHIAIRDKSTVFILTEGMPDHAPADDTMVLGDPQRALSLFVQTVSIREGNHAMNTPQRALGSTNLRADILRASPETPGSRTPFFRCPFGIAIRALSHHARGFPPEGMTTLETVHSTLFSAIRARRSVPGQNGGLLGRKCREAGCVLFARAGYTRGNALGRR